MHVELARDVGDAEPIGGGAQCVEQCNDPLCAVGDPHPDEFRACCRQGTQLLVELWLRP